MVINWSVNRENFNPMRCENIKSFLSLNCFIDHPKLNNSCIYGENQNFYDINPLGANNPSLVLVNFPTVTSRLTVNYFYRNLTKKWHSGFLPRPLEEPLHDVYVFIIVAIVKPLCKQCIKHFSYQGFLIIFDNLSPNGVNDSFKVITNIKMSSKLLSCLQYRLNKVVHQNLVFVWQGTSFRIHAVFYGDKFLDDSERDTVKAHSREILIHDRKNSPNYWCKCLPYELRREKRCDSSLYMDYVMIFPGIPSDFQENDIDLLRHRQIMLVKIYFEGLELLSDSASSSDKLE